MTIAGILLAAGQSTRFGIADKIAAPLDGVPLGLHAAQTMLALPLDARFVITNSVTLDWSGWEIVRNDRPEAGIGHSIGLGAAAARAAGASALLLALADMPFVPLSHFDCLLACHHGSESLAASGDGNRRMPPVLFGADWFDRLENLSGDQGARALLSSAYVVNTLTAHLLDIDYSEELTSIALSHQERK